MTIAPVALVTASENTQVMVHDLKDRGSADRSRINIHEAHKVRYCTKALLVTDKQLKTAVAKVGAMADAVRRELAN